MNALITWNGKQLDLIRRTVAKDTDPAEFDTFIHICRTVRLDPIRKQIFCFVFGKDDPKRRQMTVVTSIGGYRAIAERTGNYRPGRTETVLDDELKDPTTNPLGISHALATVYKYVHDEWHEITESAYWAEFAPLKDIWENNQKTGKQALDPKKDGWRRMPRVMIEKCAEAKALRRGWPDDFDGLYSEDEMDRAHTLDLSATEIANEAAAETKLALMGGKNALTVDWCDGGKLQRVAEGQFCDAALKWAGAKDRTAVEIAIWWQRNEAARAEFKARHGADYLEFQKQFEAIKNKAEQSEITQEAAE